MALSRKIADIVSDPGGKSGTEWTQDIGDSVEALWELNGGLLGTITGTNTLVGTLDVTAGFTAYTNGFSVSFLAPNTNTGAATIDLGLGPKNLRDPDGVVLVAGAYVAGRFTSVVFVAASDHFRLRSSGGTTNVTVQGGIMLQRSLPTRLAVAAGPATILTSVGSIAFQTAYANSRVLIEGNVSRVTAAGTVNVVGVSIELFVDSISIQAFTDHCEDNSHSTTAFFFEYSPGDISSHTYEIRVSSTIAATYPASANCLVCTEVSPNA